MRRMASIVGLGLIAATASSAFPGDGYSNSQAARDRVRRNTPPPESPEIETRQMRRARERAEAKRQGKPQ